MFDQSDDLQLPPLVPNGANLIEAHDDTKPQEPPLPTARRTKADMKCEQQELFAGIVNLRDRFVLSGSMRGFGWSLKRYTNHTHSVQSQNAYCMHSVLNISTKEIN